MVNDMDGKVKVIEVAEEGEADVSGSVSVEMVMDDMALLVVRPRPWKILFKAPR